MNNSSTLLMRDNGIVYNGYHWNYASQLDVHSSGSEPPLEYASYSLKTREMMLSYLVDWYRFQSAQWLPLESNDHQSSPKLSYKSYVYWKKHAPEVLVGSCNQIWGGGSSGIVVNGSPIIQDPLIGTYLFSMVVFDEALGHRLGSYQIVSRQTNSITNSTDDATSIEPYPISSFRPFFSVKPFIEIQAVSKGGLDSHAMFYINQRPGSLLQRIMSLPIGTVVAVIIDQSNRAGGGEEEESGLFSDTDLNVVNGAANRVRTSDESLYCCLNALIVGSLEPGDSFYLYLSGHGEIDDGEYNFQAIDKPVTTRDIHKKAVEAFGYNKREGFVAVGIAPNGEKWGAPYLVRGPFFGEETPLFIPLAAPRRDYNQSSQMNKEVDNQNQNEQKIKKKEFPRYQPCRSVDCYKKIKTINEGTFGIVYAADCKETGERVALKKIKIIERESQGFPITSVREIKVMMELKHPNLVDVKEIVIGNHNNIFMVMEFIEHELKGLMDVIKKPFLQSEIKTLIHQLLSGVEFLHSNWVIHRDLKTANLLYTNKGVLKIADLGLAREYGSPLKPFSEGVVTLWYRAPELLLEATIYSTPIDIWSVGCIFAEIISREILLPGTSEIDQLQKIFNLLGTPNEQIWPGFSKLPLVKKLNIVPQPYNNLKSRFPHITDNAYDLLSRLLTYDPEKRISASEALQHPYFFESPPMRDPLLMPTWPESH
ncbi:putative protein serine/threonine kinase [Cavenderia fasciculata]|uniref:cyclin-dependent kinase n=1 Tax=Cavenderia fasciculata TaxID=261658 RepID=F4PSK9_CACFS|nr:putative protein serine/threonine kinase [Cavenderia fasciculata]EGG20701.1 putative protein serine/threonine kinase [Cavenderia fasciculata]|eukprot:XP_004358551.1 putative protein serine/threonine kinase [Cavenderia fasciculata]